MESQFSLIKIQSHDEDRQVLFVINVETREPSFQIPYFHFF